MMRTGRLLTGCALGAVLAAFPAAAAAQSYQGAHSVEAGTAAVTHIADGGPGFPAQTIVTVLSPQVVIQWQPVDVGLTGAVDFQTLGTIATFQGDPALADYTVLNRIIPVDNPVSPTPVDATVAFRGTTTSLLVNNPGGHIWFYSPTGIIVGPTARFNVGSLILTTNDVAFTAASPSPLYGPDGLVQFAGPAGSTGFVDVQAGAQLNATGVNAYVAIVAPRVVQGGLVQANGQIAYIAGEEVDMTINGGLFDFVVTTGTTDPQGVVHAATAVTTGPASTSAADQQQISMVAVPKATALTMLLAGSIGYTPAASAANEGSSVVLAAGFDSDTPSALPALRDSTIEIGNATFRNLLTAYASDSVQVAPTGGTAAFQGPATLYGLTSVALEAEAGEQITAAGDLRLRAAVPGAGGTVSIDALGTGQVNVAGRLEAEASSQAAAFVAAPAFLDATGGTVTVTADAGTINALELRADAGASGEFGDSRGGDGAGGIVNVSTLAGGTISANLLALNASASGGNSARNGGLGLGGTATFSVGAGTLTAGTLIIESNAIGGSASATAGGEPYQSGTGQGGTSRLLLAGGTATATALDVQSNAFGGGGETPDPLAGELAALAGHAVGGSAGVELDAGTLNATTATIQADANGADGMNHLAGGAATNGGNGTGGTARLVSDAADSGVLVAPTLLISAGGQGGDGGFGTISGSGGNGVGGTAAGDLAGTGGFTLGAVAVLANGNGGTGGGLDTSGGEGSGATARFALTDDAAPAAARTIDALTIEASGVGGTGGGGAVAASDAGATFLTTRVFDPAAALGLAGNLTITSTGTRSAAGPGVSVAVGGAPLVVGGAIDLTTTRDAVIDADQTLRALGSIDIDARAVAATGRVDADGALSIVGVQGIAAEELESGAGTLLRADNGAVAVTVDLASAGDLTVSGLSVDVLSLGALTVADAQATGGDLRIRAGGDLTASAAQATGALTLTSDGTLVLGSPLVSTGALALRGNAGLFAGTVVSGGTTQLQSLAGPIVIPDLTSAGAVTALGGSLDLTSPGSLTFATFGTLAGDAFIHTEGNLTVTGSAGAAEALHLTTGTGNIATGNLSAGTWSYVTAAGSTAIGNLTVGTDATAGATGGNLTVGNVTAGDDIWLSIFGTDATRVLTAGTLLSTGLGDDAAASSPVLFGTYPGMAGPAGNVVRVRSSGSLALGAVQTPGRAILVADNGTIGAGAVTAGEAAIALGRGNIALGAVDTPGLFYVADSSLFALLPDAYSPASLAGAAPVRTGGALSAGAVNAGSVAVAVGGNAQAPSWTSAGGLLIDTGGVVTTGTVSAAGNARIAGDGGLSAGSVETDGELSLEAAGGSIDVAGNVRGQFARLSALQGIAVGGELASGGNLLVQAGGAFVAGGPVFTGDATIEAAGGITAGTMQTGEITRLQAPNGNVLVADLQATGSVFAGGRDVDITSTGGLNVVEAIATAGDVTLVTAGSLTALELAATGVIDVASGAVFTLNGNAHAPTIAIESNDIVVASAAELGRRGLTETVTLASGDGATRTVIGEGIAASAGDYALGQAEAARVFAEQSIAIAAQGPVSIGDLALGYGAGRNLAAGGTLQVITPATVAITGDVALTTTSADDLFLIDPTLITLDTASGSIAMLDASGNPLGRLAMVGDTVGIATGAALAQLATLTDFAAINALLDQPGGNPLALRAGTMTFDVADGLFVQNAGATALYQDRRGFSASGLEIKTASAATRIAVNGELLVGGAPLRGLATQSAVTINGAPAHAGGLFDPASTVNGCVIGAQCAPPMGSGPPSDRDIEAPLPPGDGGPSLIVAPLIELAGTDPLIAPPLVDEPITGVGNDDLWEPRCNEDEDGAACPGEDSTP